MFTTEVNIAITGLSRVGKTVFLTSLADNLEKNKDWQNSLFSFSRCTWEYILQLKQ